MGDLASDALKDARWRSEAGAPAPSRVGFADDSTTADQALRRMRSGEYLLYRGDYQNARQLLVALSRRIQKKHSRQPPRTPLEAFRAERATRAEEAAVLSRLLVPLEGDYRVALRRGPDLREACEHAWGPADAPRTVVALRELQGIVGANEWRKKGVEIAGLPGRIHPHYGVFAPTRPEYPELIARAPSPKGKRVFDVGTGSGVLGFLALARGAAQVIGTDLDPRAVASANESARALGFADRFSAVEADLFPPGRADLVICNPPWIPAEPKTRIDRAIYDPGSSVLRGYLRGLADHLEPGGEGWLLVSDLAELIGLRGPSELADWIREAKLQIRWQLTATPRHSKARDPDDPLHAVRSREVTSLYGLAPEA